MLRLKPTKNACKRLIKIHRRAFEALFIMLAAWHHLGNPSLIQRPRLNRNDSHPMHFIRAVDRRLIEDLMVTPKSPYKLRYSSMM